MPSRKTLELYSSQQLHLQREGQTGMARYEEKDKELGLHICGEEPCRSALYRDDKYGSDKPPKPDPHGILVPEVSPVEILVAPQPPLPSPTPPTPLSRSNVEPVQPQGQDDFLHY